MFVNKNITFRGLLYFTGGHLIWLTTWAVVGHGSIHLGW